MSLQLLKVLKSKNNNNNKKWNKNKKSNFIEHFAFFKQAKKHDAMEKNTKKTMKTKTSIIAPNV
jgi:hypothetical protein